MVKFRNTWDLMEKKVQCLTHVDPEKPSETEITPPFNISALLKSMSKADALQILGFAGSDMPDFDDPRYSEDLEKEYLEDVSEFENETADAVDRLEELEQRASAIRSNSKKLSAGDVTKQQSQADTTLTDEVGIKTSSASLTSQSEE